MNKLRRALNPKATRAPRSFEDAVGIELGSLLEFETDGGKRIKAPRGTNLLWFPGQKALGFFEGAKETRPSERIWNDLDGSGASKARSTFKRWADRESKKARRIDFRSKNARWAKSPDKVSRIDYRSDKWGETAEYTHNTGRNVGIYLLSSSRTTPAFWVFLGGSLRVTNRGIEG